MKRRLRISTIIFRAILCCMLCGCAGNTEIGNPDASSGWIAMSNEAELDAYLRDQLRADITADAFPPSGGLDSGGDDIPGLEVPPQATGGSIPGNRVISEGRFLYAADGERVVILTTGTGGRPEIIAELPAGGTPTALHLSGARLVIVGRAAADTPEPSPGFFADARTALRFVDVSNPANPRILRDIRIEGEDLASVMAGGRLHLVQRFRPGGSVGSSGNPGNRDPGVTVQEDFEQVEAASLADLTPDFAVFGPDGAVRLSGPLLAPTDIYRPDWPAGGSMTVITAVNPSNPDDSLRSIALIGNVDSVHAGDSAIHMGLTRACDASVPCEPGDSIRTFLFRVNIEGDTPRFTATGSVRGGVDSGGFDERDGILRVLSAMRTDTFPEGGSRYSSRLTSMTPRDGRLETLSVFESGVLPNRPRIRFVDSHAYLFSDSGELIPLDLSDPAAPRSGKRLWLEGSLSDLFPADGDRLVGIGPGPDGANGEGSLQVCLIDISEPDAPRLVDRESGELPGTTAESIGKWGPPALAPEVDLLAVPLVVADPTPFHPDRFGGIWIYRLTSAGFEFSGTLAVPDAVFEVTDTPSILPGFIGNRIYLFHPGGLTHADPDHLDSGPETLWFTGV